MVNVRKIKMSSFKPRRIKYRHHGFTLIEVMIAITLGLLVIVGMTMLFVNSRQAQGEIEKANRQIESGRFAMQLMTDDVRHAGFYGEFDPSNLVAGALPDPCSTTLADLRAALPYPIQGYDNGGSLSGTCSGILTDLKANTDILVLRRTSTSVSNATCASDDSGCEVQIAGAPYFQASLCSLELQQVATRYALDSDTTNLTLHQNDCTSTFAGTTAVLRRYITHIYYVANNHIGSDGIPTLKRAELGAGSGGLSFTVVPLVEGIDNLQIEYGMGDVATPTTVTDYNAARADAEWPRVVAVKIHLLARNTIQSPGFIDTKSYVLGRKADQTENRTYATRDAYKRHVFQGVIGLDNPAARLEP
jgi:type IV pilus assembly protein PilW